MRQGSVSKNTKICKNSRWRWNLGLKIHLVPISSQMSLIIVYYQFFQNNMKPDTNGSGLLSKQ